jgi:hypothetical protein
MFGILKNKFVRVNFSNRGFSRVIRQSSDVSDKTPDKSTVLNLADLMANLKTSRGTPITFDSIPDLEGVDYVGYVIEKERLNKATGDWVRTDEIKIIGSESDSFIDTRVAYGESYRYRMKSVIRFTQAEEVDSFSHLEAIQDVQTFEAKRIQEELEKNLPVLEEINKITGLGLTTKTSAGIIQEVISILGNTSLKIDASSTSLVRESPIVQNQDLRVLDNLRVENLNFMQGNVTDIELKKLFNTALENFREKKRKYKSSYYESYATRNWIYVDIVENELPPPPTAIKIVPNTLKKEIFISWLKPSNNQRDIQSYRLYKRENIGDPWKIIAQFREYDLDSDGDIDPLLKNQVNIPVTDNVYVDTNVEIGKKYIYALACVDVHNITSFLSAQIQVELNANYKLDQEELPLKWISGSGAKPSETNFVIKKFFNRTETIVAKKNIFVSPTTKFSEISKDLLVRVISLDTHETKEFKIRLKNLNMTKKN